MIKGEKASLWTLPNRLSILRILLIPIVIILISTEDKGFLLVACLLFIIAGITDGLDGYIARKMELKSRLGLYLDPLADKLLVVSVLITLSCYKLVPLWITIILVVREFVINGLRSFYAIEGIAISPSFAGKMKTALQLIAISCILFSSSIVSLEDMIHSVGIFLLYCALFFSLFSAFNYIKALFRPHSKGLL